LIQAHPLLALLTVLALVYATMIHLDGYAGDPNDFLDVVTDNDWADRPDHFVYYAALTPIVWVLELINVNIYLAQTIISLAGALVVVSSIYIISERLFSDIYSRVTVSLIFGLSGQTMMTATYGEVYMIQIAAILGSAALLYQYRYFAGAFVAILSIGMAVVSLAMLPLPALLWYLGWKSSTARLKMFMLSALGAVTALVAMFALASISDPGFLSAYWELVSGGNSTLYDSPITTAHIRNYILWFIRGFNILIPAVLLGLLVSLRNGPRFVLWLYIITIVLNIFFILKVDDFWRMLGFLWLAYAVWATIGISFSLRKARISGRWPLVFIVGALLVFGILNRLDMGERERAVASEMPSIIKTVVDEYSGSVVLGSNALISSFDHYEDRFNVSDADITYDKNVIPPVLWVPLNDSVSDSIDTALDSGQPVNVVVRTLRYDTPIMRLAFPGGLGTSTLDVYRHQLGDYSLEYVSRIGKFHELYVIGRP
jgi:hypothetical protein